VEEQSRRQLLAEVASLYYREKQTQSRIGKDLGYSRSAISRLLDEAEKKGIVKIFVDYPIQRASDLEQKLVTGFGLKDAYVIKRGQLNYDQSLELVGRMGASYFEQRLKDNMVIGIGWGTSIYEVVNALPDIPLNNVNVVQVVGAIGGKSDPRVDGAEITSFFASKLKASYHSLHSPLFLDSREACQSLMSQKQIMDTFRIAYRADFVLLGIGTIDVDDKYSSLYRSGMISEKDVREIKEKGGVCNFCGLIFDENGRFLDIDLNHRVMAVDLSQLKNKNNKIIGIAAGKEKTTAIKAALKGGLIDILFTDEVAVNPIINLTHKREAGWQKEKKEN